MDCFASLAMTVEKEWRARPLGDGWEGRARSLKEEVGGLLLLSSDVIGATSDAG